MLNVFANVMLEATRSNLAATGPVRDKWLSPAVRRQQSRRAISAAIGQLSNQPAARQLSR